MDEDTDLVTLVDEEGKEHHFELIDLIEVDERRYAVMIPVEEERAEDEEEGEAYIFRLETDKDGEEILVNIDDEDEFDRVCAALEDQDEDFDDEEGE